VGLFYCDVAYWTAYFAEVFDEEGDEAFDDYLIGLVVFV
jgi:hypothetical protein